MVRKSPAFKSPLECGKCGVLCVRTGPVQKYCSACSESRNLMRKRLWARSHPLSKDVASAKVRARRGLSRHAKKAGAIVSRQNASSIAWRVSREIESSWLVRVAVPFSYAASKNHIYSLDGRGHQDLRKESNAFQTLLIARLKSAIAGRRMFSAKVWIDILVQKPDHRGDAVNVVDLVCDAVKAAIGIDDRWFCIRRLDWEIVKSNPLLYVGVTQEESEDHQVCSYCGMVLPLDRFTGDRSGKLGVGRECKSCMKLGRDSKRNGV